MSIGMKKFSHFILFAICLTVFPVFSSETALGQPLNDAPATANPKRAMAAPGDKVLEPLVSGLAESVSPLAGEWGRQKVAGDITWFSLVFSAVLLTLVIGVERLLRWLLDRKSAVPGREDAFPLIAYFFQALSRPFSLLFFTYGIYIVLIPLLDGLALPSGDNPFQTACGVAVHLISIIVVIWFLVRLVSLVDLQLKRWTKKSDGTINDLLVPLVNKTLRALIIVLGGVIILQNMTGIEIGPLLASLGIGGIAVALAAKDSIANFFGTLTIVFDKPFKPGERILIDGHDGTVESVGFRSTRIRTLTGHLLTIPNEKVTNSSIENIGRRPNIRWLANIGITYDTPPEKIEQAVAIIKEILHNHEGMREDAPPRVYFNNFNDWSLNIMVVAWYHPADYWAYMDWLEKTCLEIMRRFARAGINFAFPSQTIYMTGVKT